MKVLGYVQNTGWEEMIAVWHYRCLLPLRELALKTDFQVGIVNGADTDGNYAPFDVYHWPRHTASDGVAGFIDAIHDLGGLFVIDADDDLTERYKPVHNRGEEFIEVISLADYLTVSTPALARELVEYTKNPPVVLRNCIDVDWMTEQVALGRRGIKGLTIGFSGSPTHWGDWRVAAVPFRRICQDFDVTPVLHGEVPRYLNFTAGEERLRKIPGVPFCKYPISLSQFDIVLCAVDPDDEFNSGKSAIKALECMAVGAVPICSRFAPYIELAEAGAPIILVEENTRDAWYEAMAKTIKYADRREWLSNAGPTWVRENRDMTRTGYKHWEAFYRSIV